MTEKLDPFDNKTFVEVIKIIQPLRNGIDIYNEITSLHLTIECVCKTLINTLDKNKRLIGLLREHDKELFESESCVDWYFNSDLKKRTDEALMEQQL